MIKPRIHWVTQHTVLRYEEVPLLIEAGAEVIPSLGDPVYIEEYFDKGYDDEHAAKYPDWRASCTLPADVVEKIRRTYLLPRWGKVTQEEADFINRWIDVIFVSTYPDMLANIMEWFQGYIVYRTFGFVALIPTTDLFKQHNVDIAKITAYPNYVWCPILKGLHEPEDPRLIKNEFYLNAFVSKARLPYRWAGRQSQPAFTMSMSYIKRPAVRKLYDHFVELFSDIPYTVLGKNTEADQQKSGKIAGYLDDTAFYSQITGSRMYLYIGIGSNYHVHYTPIEAVAMGTPIVFREVSGMAQEARDFGMSNQELKAYGMCKDLEEMHDFVSSIWQDFDALEDLAHRQNDLYSQIFSRDRALKSARGFYDRLQPFLDKKRRIPYYPSARPIHKDSLFNQVRSDATLRLDAGDKLRISMDKMVSLTGKETRVDEKGRFVRHFQCRSDVPGLAAARYLNISLPGIYRLTFTIDPLDSGKGKLGDFIFGIFKDSFTILNSRPVLVEKGGELDESMLVDVGKSMINTTLEVRLMWDGGVNFDLKQFEVERLA